FAKLFLDRLGIYKLREKIDKQTGVTYYFYQAIFFFDSLLYHSSIYLAPLGLLVLIIDLIIKTTRRRRMVVVHVKIKKVQLSPVRLSLPMAAYERGHLSFLFLLLL